MNQKGDIPKKKLKSGLQEIIDKDFPDLPRITRWNKDKIAEGFRFTSGDVIRFTSGDVRLATGRVYTFHELEIQRARILSTQVLPGGTFAENLKFYLNPSTLKHKYNLFMLIIEDHFPNMYNYLTNLGIPGYKI